MARESDTGPGAARNWRRENLDQKIFHAGLQHFAHQVSYVTGLETGGKIDPEAAFLRLKLLFEQLQEQRLQQRFLP